MKRHIFITCLALCAILSAAAQEQFTEGNLTYNVLADGSLAVCGCAPTEQMVIVPERVEHEGTTRTVTAVADSAFANIQASAIGLPETVTTIGAYAFSECFMLTYVHIPAAVTSIGAQAFNWCTSLGHLDLPAGLQQLGDGSFYICDHVYTFGAEELPQLKSVPDHAFFGCTTTRTLPRMEALDFIGTSAFEGCYNLNAMDLSRYHGAIGLRAFNGCNSLGHLQLPTDHPFYRVISGGQAIVGRDEEFITALPTLKELTLNYPATGENGAFKIGDYSDMTRLELPCTWKATNGLNINDRMQDLTLRMPEMCDLTFQGKSLKVHVFDYVLDQYTRALGRQPQFELQTIDLPTSQLYVEEVTPRYADKTKLLLGDKNLFWTADFNAELQEAFPDYFTHKGLPEELPKYRGLFYDQYVLADRMAAYDHGGELVRCINGTIRLTEEFDVNDYFNWYAHIDTVSPAVPYEIQNSTELLQVEADATGAHPQEACWLFSTPTGSWSSPSVTFALPLLPTIPYDIYLLLPGHHPLTTEEAPVKNKIAAQITVNQGDLNSKGSTKLTKLSEQRLDIAYEGAPQELLLAENLEVQGDYGNALSVSSKATPSDLKGKGYTHAFPLIGIRLVPKRDIEWLPSNVEMPAQGVTILSSHDLVGRRLSAPARGVNILHMSDGTTRKVILRR